MSRRQFLQGVGAIWLLSASYKANGMETGLLAVRLWPSSTYTRITLESSGLLRWKQFSLSSPNRLVIDIDNLKLTQIFSAATKLVRGDDPYIKGLRVAQYSPTTVRLVLELKQQIQPRIYALQPFERFRHRLVIDLYPKLNEAADPLLAFLQDYQSKNQPMQNKSSVNVEREARTHPIVIMLDPGHGGEDPGAQGKYHTLEKNIVLSIGKRLKRLIDKQPNMRAYLTRSDDIFIPLRVRVEKARRVKADLFVSIHADAFTNRSAHGASVFALSTRGATSAAAKFLANSQNQSDLIGGVSFSSDSYLNHALVDMAQSKTIEDSLTLGQAVLQRMKSVNHLHKAIVDQAGFAVLKAPDIPSILVETAFISNVNEERRLRTQAYQAQVAKAILAGIKDYFAKGAMLAER